MIEVGEWAVFKSTSIIGTAIFPSPRLIKSIEGNTVHFKTDLLPQMTFVSNIINTYASELKAKNAIEVALAAWEIGEASIQLLERKIARARKKRLDAVVALIAP